MRGIGWGLLLTCALGAAFALALTLLTPKPVVYRSGERNYRIVVQGKEASTLRGDRIEWQNGCVVFYRGERIDTLMCEASLTGVVVTEIPE